MPNAGRAPPGGGGGSGVGAPSAPAPQRQHTSSAAAANDSAPPKQPDLDLVSSLQLLDPVLQFLTKATGRPLVPLSTLRKAVPGGEGVAGGDRGAGSDVLDSVPELARRGILRVVVGGRGWDGGEDDDEVDSDDRVGVGAAADGDGGATTLVGFPLKPSHFGGGGDDDGANGVNADGSSSSSLSPPPVCGGSLHGSTKSGAKRRLAALRRSLKADEKRKKQEKQQEKKNASARGRGRRLRPASVKSAERKKHDNNKQDSSEEGVSLEEKSGPIAEDETTISKDGSHNDTLEDANNACTQEETDALGCLQKMLGLKEGEKKSPDEGTEDGEEDMQQSLEAPPRTTAEPWLPNQAKISGCSPARRVRYGELSENSRSCIPDVLADALGLDLDGNGGGGRRLFKHQSEAVASILNGDHTIVCTGTGSGKSLCFLLPVLATVMNSDTDLSSSAALIMFPTKALAQDQLSKLLALVNSHPTLLRHIRPGVIDGDTPHANRSDIAKGCNVILTNPDTIHAAILPGWKRVYKRMLSRVRHVVIDESHMYEGAFGAHVALVLARLVRVCAAAYHTSEDHAGVGIDREKLVFVACSATMGRPEEHFRLLCPVGEVDRVTVLAADSDGSPCGAKYFFTWNPPLLHIDGKSTGKLVVSRAKGKVAKVAKRRIPTRKGVEPTGRQDVAFDFGGELQAHGTKQPSAHSSRGNQRRSPIHRRHAADETARLLAEAVRTGVRCIAFCKTRSLVEWVFERCLTNLQADKASRDLAKKVESYRGGYSAEARRTIEKRLFREELIGVVATSALELGVDIGGIDLTLHCGYPGSISSLMQQSGRAGRGGKTDTPSVAVMVCFSSPSEQHLWRRPKSLLSRGIDAPPSVPINAGILHGHMLCAGDEYPLVGNESVTRLLRNGQCADGSAGADWVKSDKQLFGEYYTETEAKLKQSGLLSESRVKLYERGSRIHITTFSTHPSVGKPWMHVSMRSIEPISYSIVDMNHRSQGGRTDTINDKAVMDTIPYSRVFYHAHPGAVIKHRGRSYKIITMNSPPAFADCTIGYNRQSCNLGAFAKPSNASYSTRPLSLMHITVVKQFDRVELTRKQATSAKENAQTSSPVTKGSDRPAPTSVPERKCDETLFMYPERNFGSIAGNGVVTVKRSVHGYKKLSPVNRTELSRHELKMPSMEFDTNAIWFDVEASLLVLRMRDFDAGVHAFSHALCAVAPLFVPCTSSDLDCDHTRRECTRVLLFDVRAGGAGTVSRLWRHFFRPEGIVSAAIELLEYCPTCSDDTGFGGGCPGCLQSCPCINFHEDLSRTAGALLAKRLLRRLEKTDLYRENARLFPGEGEESSVSARAQATPERSLTAKTEAESPRRLARKRALRFAQNLESAKKRSVIVGRPTWPADERL